MKWKPIETAPKDGTGILGFISETWIEGIFWNGAEWSYLCDGDITPYGRSQPTHWMPLPPIEDELRALLPPPDVVGGQEAYGFDRAKGES